MAHINGKYEHEKSENLKEFILGVGMPEEFAAKAAAASASMEVSKNGDEITIVTIYASKPPTTLKFKLGEEFDDPMPNGLNLRSIAKMEGDEIKVESKKDGADIGYRSYHFCEKGARITMGSKLTPVICKRCYKRV